jgi:hypothetical protein
MTDNNLFIIDDRSSGTIQTALGTSWRLVTDSVMGGVSKGSLTMDNIDCRSCLHLQGKLSLENNGGFIQAAMDLSINGEFDASGHTGIIVDLYGNNQSYNIHLRTKDVLQPWQSYRSSFIAKQKWQTLKFPFSRFTAYRISKPLDIRKLIRVGIVAIGREFSADLCIARIGLF